MTKCSDGIRSPRTSRSPSDREAHPQRGSEKSWKPSHDHARPTSASSSGRRPWVEIYEYSRTDLNTNWAGSRRDLPPVARPALDRRGGYIKATKYENHGGQFQVHARQLQRHHAREGEALQRQADRRVAPHASRLRRLLSNYDRFIQEEFFDLPYHVALVVDPRANKFGFFQWKRGRIESCAFLLRPGPAAGPIAIAPSPLYFCKIPFTLVRGGYLCRT